VSKNPSLGDIIKLLAEQKPTLPQQKESPSMDKNQVIDFEGTEVRLTPETTFSIPKRMVENYDLSKAIKFLTRAHNELLEMTQLTAGEIKALPWDGALATQAVIHARYGHNGYGVQGMSSSVEIEVGPSERAYIPWGAYSVPELDAVFHFDQVDDKKLGSLFRLIVECPKRRKVEVQEVFAQVVEYLKHHSIYRGKAVVANEYPTFLPDPKKIDEKAYFFSSESEVFLQALLWNIIERTEDVVKENPNAANSRVLAYGPPGTGKTSIAKITAKKCVENGWTFVECPVEYDLQKAIQFARFNMPAVLLVEDIERLVDPTDDASIASNLQVFDGLTSKDDQIIILMTSNRDKQIIQGMQRPGRTDVKIEIGHLDDAANKRMIEYHLGDRLANDIDWEAVFRAMEGYEPAFTLGSVNRSKMFNLGTTVIGTDELVHAANSFRAQYDDYKSAQYSTMKPTLDTTIADTVRQAVTGMEILNPEGRNLGKIAQESTNN
jgi:hypothetical protein